MIGTIDSPLMNRPSIDRVHLSTLRFIQPTQKILDLLDGNVGRAEWIINRSTDHSPLPSLNT